MLLKRITTVAVAGAAGFALLVAPAYAALEDTGSKGEVEASCEDLGGEFEANGWGTADDPTCVVEEEVVVVQDNNGVSITTGGGETTYIHEDTETDRNAVIDGAWTVDSSTQPECAGMMIVVKKTGKEICAGGK